MADLVKELREWAANIRRNGPNGLPGNDADAACLDRAADELNRLQKNSGVIAGNQHTFRCDYGSGAVLSIGENAHHAVLCVTQKGAKTSVALTPETMMSLASRLALLAGQCGERRSFDGTGATP